MSSVKKIVFVGFRNLKQPIEPERLVVFSGSNGAGKTSVVEAVYLALVGESFRGTDTDMIHYSADNGGVSIDFGNDTRQVKLNRTPQTKSYFVNDEKIRSRNQFSKGVGVVLFEPDELRMLTGPSELRRRWLDTVISSVSEKYPKILANYNRALKQRNRLLKTGVVNQDEYFVWELKLSEFGALIINSRQKLLAKLNEKISEKYQLISSGGEEIEFSYSQSNRNDISSWLVSMLKTNRTHDQRVGHTTVGPHRDDFEVYRNKKPLAETGSRGEIRSVVLAMKLFEAETTEKHVGHKPIILLDDVLSELDSARRLRLLEVFKGHQTFITATEIDQAITDEFNPQIIEL